MPIAMPNARPTSTPTPSPMVNRLARYRSLRGQGNPRRSGARDRRHPAWLVAGGWKYRPGAPTYRRHDRLWRHARSGPDSISVADGAQCLPASGASLRRAGAECANHDRNPGPLCEPGAPRGHHLTRQRAGQHSGTLPPPRPHARGRRDQPQELRKIMELELDNKEEQEEKIPQLFESAGGFAPTIGIIGAVLGLIQVMQHLDKIDEVGKGIAVAFVATLYGVGAANLILLPASGKLKIRIRDEQIIREMTIEGVVSILEGMNPHILDAKLLGFLTRAHQPAISDVSAQSQ